MWGCKTLSKYCIVLCNVFTPTCKTLDFKHASQSLCVAFVPVWCCTIFKDSLEGSNHGNRKGVRGASSPRGFWNLTVSYELLSKKGCFVRFEWVKLNFTTFPPLEKSFWHLWKNPLLPPPWKKSFRRRGSNMRMNWLLGITATKNNFDMRHLTIIAYAMTPDLSNANTVSNLTKERINSRSNNNPFSPKDNTFHLNQ